MNEKTKIPNAGGGDANPKDGAPGPGDGTTAKPDADRAKAAPEEVGGRGGLDPTRYGDWEVKGRCIDF